MRVALVHDWLTGRRGGEKVLEVLCQLYPQADIFTLVYRPGSCGSIIESHTIYPSMIQRLPLATSRYRNYLPLFPTAIEKLDLRSYDLVISSSHCVAKGVITKPGSVHIAYIHSPMRYVWDLYYDYFSKDKAGWLQRLVMAGAANYLRMWDVTSSQRVDHLVANSHFVAQRIKKYWGRQAEVIYPPVDLGRFKPSQTKDNYYLIVSALVPYKKIDLAVKALTKAQLPLKVVGTGPEFDRLRSIAGPTVELLGYQDDATVERLYARARAFLYPGEEDFGITALEALASGTPVIAYASGGVVEIVSDGHTGLLFHQQHEDDLLEAIDRFDTMTWSTKKLTDRAYQFSGDMFRQRLQDMIAQQLKVQRHNLASKSGIEK